MAEGERPPSSATPEAAREGAESPTRKRVAIASDHAGFALKLQLVQALSEAKIDFEDLGPQGPASVDYPDYARAVSEAVAGKKADLGVLCCGSGIGMSIAANKVKGVRAALC